MVSAGTSGLSHAPLNGSLLEQRPWKSTRRLALWAIFHAISALSLRSVYRLDTTAVRTLPFQLSKRTHRPWMCARISATAGGHRIKFFPCWVHLGCLQ